MRSQTHCRGRFKKPLIILRNFLRQIWAVRDRFHKYRETCKSNSDSYCSYHFQRSHDKLKHQILYHTNCEHANMLRDLSFKNGTCKSHSQPGFIVSNWFSVIKQKVVILVSKMQHLCIKFFLHFLQPSFFAEAPFSKKCFSG